MINNEKVINNLILPAGVVAYMRRLPFEPDRQYSAAEIDDDGDDGTDAMIR